MLMLLTLAILVRKIFKEGQKIKNKNSISSKICLYLIHSWEKSMM